MKLSLLPTILRPSRCRSEKFAFARTATHAIAALVVGFGLSSAAQASTFSFGTYDFTQSNAFGTGSFGTVTVSDLGGGTAKIDVEVNPDFIIETGSHFAFTFSLAGGTVDTSSFNSTRFSLDAPPPAGGYTNDPFKFFTSAIDGACGNGGTTICGSSLIFDVKNFAGLIAATNLFNGQTIIFAADIFEPQGVCQQKSCTGVVGAVATPIPGALALLAPVLGAGFVALRRRRRA
jgi:hypothetical protein